jgi:hypothetical protein
MNSQITCCPQLLSSVEAWVKLPWPPLRMKHFIRRIWRAPKIGGFYVKKWFFIICILSDLRAPKNRNLHWCRKNIWKCMPLRNGYFYTVFHQFRQAKFAYGGSLLSSSQFALLPLLPQNLTDNMIIVTNDSKRPNKKILRYFIALLLSKFWLSKSLEWRGTNIV